jgi:hypothetical protein
VTDQRQTDNVEEEFVALPHSRASSSGDDDYGHSRHGSGDEFVHDVAFDTGQALVEAVE